MDSCDLCKMLECIYSVVLFRLVVMDKIYELFVRLLTYLGVRGSKKKLPRRELNPGLGRGCLMTRPRHSH